MPLTKILSGLVAGLLFGAGLAVSDMTNPNKVLNFLDVAHGWDQSLALVMVGAIAVSAFGFALARRRSRPLFDDRFVLPVQTRLEPSLMIGSALFGLGWGFGGYCPGPAIASLTHPSAGLIAFLGAMVCGLLLSAWLSGRAIGS
jgi:uncharacterized membrane protein YedE/YeeE